MEQRQRLFNILIVDDSAPVRERLAAMLAQLPGAGKVWTAADFLSGLETFQTLDPDVAVIDIHLPGAGGIDLLKRFKIGKPGLFAITLTNHQNQAYREAALRAGCDRLFHKDSEFELVATVVEQEFQRRSKAHATP